MFRRRTSEGRGCMARHSRRRFLAAAGATAAAAKLGLLDFASSLFAQEAKPAGKPLVKVVFVRPDKEPVVSWPGGNCDVPAQQALFTRTLEAAAKKLDVQLQVHPQPIVKPAEVNAYLEQLGKPKPPAARCRERFWLQQIPARPHHYSLTANRLRSPAPGEKICGQGRRS